MEYRVNHYPNQTQPDPVRHIYTPLKYYSPRTYRTTSRYKNVRTIKTAHDIHPNKFIPQSHKNNECKEYHEAIYNRGVKDSTDDKYYTVTTTTTNRLDIIASMFYDSATLWWIIAQANRNIIFNPFNIPKGTVLRIPSLTSVYSTGGILDV